VRPHLYASALKPRGTHSSCNVHGSYMGPPVCLLGAWRYAQAFIQQDACTAWQVGIPIIIEVERAAIEGLHNTVIVSDVQRCIGLLIPGVRQVVLQIVEQLGGEGNLLVEDVPAEAFSARRDCLQACRM
jgi:hypothetical protein